MSALDTLLDLAPHLAEDMRPGPGHVMVRCPFHGGGMENTPSLSISTTKPVWFCHGCKRAGHIAVLLSMHGMSRDAINALLPREGYQQAETLAAKLVKGVDPFKGKFILDEGLLDYYRLAPKPLLQAGFTHQTLRHFEVGFDMKNFRITYPLRTAYGDLVGISGRTVFADEEPRYRIYDRELKERTDYPVPKDYSMESVKSAVLWHAHVVRPFFFPTNGDRELLVTEGFKACMWTFQAGLEDVVALVGSYLTQIHAELIARVTRKVTLLLDNNEAGHKGTLKAGRLLLSKGVDVRVAQYPDAREQPDELTPTELAQSIDQKQSLRAWVREHPGL